MMLLKLSKGANHFGGNRIENLTNNEIPRQRIAVFSCLSMAVHFLSETKQSLYGSLLRTASPKAT